MTGPQPPGPQPPGPQPPGPQPPQASGPSWSDRLSAVGRIEWSRHLAEAREGQAAPPPPERRKPRLDLSTWAGALVFMLGAVSLLWIVQIVNVADHYSLDRFGLRPRAVSGLWGVLTQPFLHASWGHLVSNTVSFVIIGGALVLGGLRSWLIATVIVIVVGGLLTWLVAPGGVTVVGASGVIFGWLGYLISRAYFTRKIRWIVSAVVVVAFFGGLLSGLVPNLGSNVSWQSHLCGFVSGILAGAVLHPRRPRRGARAVAAG